MVTLGQAFVVPDAPSALEFSFDDLVFDETDTGFINDAFEVALLDPFGNSLVPSIDRGHDAFFNVTEQIATAAASGVTITENKVVVDISGLTTGETANLVFRLINDDADSASTVRITELHLGGLQSTSTGIAAVTESSSRSNVLTQTSTNISPYLVPPGEIQSSLDPATPKNSDSASVEQSNDSAESSVFVQFKDFSDTSALKLNGAARTLNSQDGRVLRVTSAGPSQAGSFFSSTQVNAADFSSAFSFRITNRGGRIFDCNSIAGADGIVFVVQSVSSSIGSSGQGIGYAGISRSVGVEFDTWCNAANRDPSSNHIGINVGGTVNHGSGAPHTRNISPDFDNGSIWYAWVDYDGTELEVRVSQNDIRPEQPQLTRQLDIPQIINSETAFVGFTSGTGADWGNHDIINWQYNESFDPIGVPEFTINARTARSRVEVGDQTLITGDARSIIGKGGPTEREVSITHVLINDRPVNIVDASGSFFAYVEVGPGENRFEITAFDALDQQSQTSLTITGLSSGDDIDFSRFSDITDTFQEVYGRTSFKDSDDRLLVDLATRNTGTFETDVPLLVGIKNISDPTVSVVGADGFMPGGTPYYDYTEAVRDGTLEAGETTDSPTVTFHTPSRQQFDYELVFYGKLNEAPIIESLPKIEAAYDREYRYEVLATDPEDDPLSYTLTTKPAGMDFAPGTTDVVWQPSISDIGYHDVVVTVSDGRGGTAEQRFTIEVLEAPPNRPPVFTSVPITSTASTSFEFLGTDIPIISYGEAGQKYLVGSHGFLPGFEQPGFDDSDFLVGQGAFGSPRNGCSNLPSPIRTNWPTNTDLLVRHEIDLPSNVRNIRWYGAVDNRYELFWNGQRIGGGGGGCAQRDYFRANVSDSLVNVGENTLAIRGIDLGVVSYLDFRLIADFVPEGIAEPEYLYSASAIDSDNDPLSFSLQEAPDGMQVAPTTGTITWNPTVKQIGNHRVVLEVSDGRGGVATQEFIVCVHPDPDNHDPVIISEPVTSITVPARSTGSVLYGIDFADPTSLYRVDDLNSNAVVVGSTTVSELSDLAIDPSTGEAFAINADGLYQLSLETAETAFIGATGLPAPSSLEILPDGRIIAADFESSQLYLVDRSTGAATVLFDTGWLFHGDVAFDPLSGDLFGSAFQGPPPASDTLIQIDLDRKTVSAVGDLGMVVTGLGFTSDGRLLAANSSSTNVYVVDPKTSMTRSVYDAGITLGAGLALRAVEITSDPTTHFGIEFPLGDLSFADRVVRYEPGPDVAGVGDDNPQNALGPPEPNGEFGTRTELGKDGVLVVEFVDNYLVDQQDVAGGLDLYIFEAGSAVESFQVEISENGIDWIDLGTVKGQPTGIDIGPFVDANSVFRFVRLTDVLPDETRGEADINAIGAIGSIDASAFYQYDVDAIDPDLDALSYSLLDGPDGIVIDPDNGLVTGTFSADAIGIHPVTVRVEDGRGGFDEQRFTINVRSSAGGEIRGRKTVVDVDPVVIAESSFDEGPGGWTIFLDQNQNGVRDAGERFTITDQNGDYAFTDLAEGRYTVREEARQGWEQTYPGRPVGSRLIAMSEANGDVFEVDPKTGQAVRIASIGLPADSFEFIAPYTAYLGHNSNRVSRFDLKTGTATEVAVLDGVENIEALAFDGVNLYAAISLDQDGQAERLAIIDVENSQWSEVAVFGAQFTDVDSLAVLPDGRLLFTHLSQPFSIGVYDPLTKAVTNLGGLEYSVIGLDVDRDGTIFATTYDLFTSGSQSLLLEIDLNGPIATVIGDTQIPIAAGLSVVPDYTIADGYSVHVARNHVVSDVDFTNRKLSDGPNRRPAIQSQPVTANVVGALYRYNVSATDPDKDPLTFQLPVAPAGMTIHPSLGAMVWQPSFEQVGTHEVLVQVTDGRGGSNVQSFSISVDDPNVAPVITSQPVRTAVRGATYQYELTAQDADGDPITFEIDGMMPVGMTIEPVELENSDEKIVESFHRLTWSVPFDAADADTFIRVVARDCRGGETVQQWSIDLLDAATVNRFPEITSTPRLKARHGLPWSYRVSAFDPDGEALTYALGASPQGMQITSDGLVTWTPPLDTDTSVAVDVIVSDGRGGEKRQPFRLGIVSVDTNLAPSINSVPPIAAVLDQSYAYDPSAKDPDGDSITWNLTVAPRGMSIDAVSGKIRWLPDDQQLGSHQVVLTANDIFLGHATQRFTIHVGCNNLAPAIVSVPPTVALSDRIYLYPARGEDFENDSLRWRLVNAPAGMSIDESNGVIRWTPNSGQIGSHDVLVEVRDELGFGTQSYTLVVNSADAPVDPNNPDGPTKGNRAPIITSAPVFNSEVGSLYQYQVRAIDADGDNVTIALADGSPAGMEINDGLVTWTPTESDIGTPLISILAIDQFGATSTQGYVLSVITNQPPSITSAPNTQVTRGATYRYTVAAEDPDRDPLTWSLGDSAPAGMSIDNKGRILWETTGFANDSVDVTVIVTDNRGQPDSQDWTITINDDTQPPAVDLVVIVGDQAHRGTAQVDLGADYRVRVTATDNVAVTDIRLLVDGRPVTLDAFGLVRLPTIATGDISLTAYANDAAGLEGSTSATITVVNPSSNNPPKESEPGFPTRPDPDPSDAGEPVVEITKPVLGKRISNATLIEGSAYDPEGNFWYYDVRYARADRVSLANIDIDDPDWVLIKRSSSEVRAGELAVFDPALVSNDAYAIIVTAFDSNGRGYVQPTMVYVEGSVQTGNFQLQLTDLTIPLSGIPIEVTRVYDTLEATESGDFGYGWKLGVQDARIFEATAIGSGSAFNGGNDKFVPGVTKVYLTNPDGQRIGFTYNLTDLQASWFGTTARPVFTPDEGVYDTLTIDTTSVAVGGILGALGGGINPDVYTLTTKDGTKYRYNQFTGLQTVTDRNGNVVTFTEDGISHTSGESIQFIRDHRGRITSVIDPAGERISYEYDLKGDLVEVTNQIDLKTRYEYRQTPPHYLDNAYDSLGRKVMEAVYEQDAETRLYEFKGVVDALGNRVDERDFQTDQNTGVVRDGNGNATTLIYDDRGNVLQEIDPLGLATLREYGDSRNPDAETRIVDRRGFITDQEFDARGNVTKITERGSEANPFAEPIVTLFSYDNGNRVKSITNPLGHVTAFNYDRAGNLIRIKNAEDNTSSFTYDDEGRRASFTDFNGNTTVYDYTDACPCGSPSKATFADGTYQTFQYNQFGQVTEESTHEADGTLVEYRKTFYDKAGRVIEQQTGLEGDPNHPPTIVRSVYDGHLLDWEIIVNPESPNDTPATPVADRKSRITDYEYDAKDRLIRQIDAEAWWNSTTERFENRKGEARGVVEFRYDANDNRILLQDPVGNITTWVYDELNRVVEERDPFYNENLTIDAAIALLETPSGADLAANTGAEHVRAFAYDGEGNQIEMIDRNGRRREFDYDHSGRLTEERWYNEAEHSTDPLALVNTLAFTYDALGNMLTAQDVNSHYVHTYDALNRLTSVDNNPEGTLDLPRVILTYQYDAQGNVIETQDDAGVTVASEYDERNRLAIRRWYDADVPTSEDPDVDPVRVDFLYTAAGRESDVFRYSDLDSDPANLVGRTERTYDTTGKSNLLTHLNATDELLAGYDYDYDFSGLLVHEARTHQETQYEQTIDYQYDLTGQLTFADFDTQDDEHYEYDANGNRTHSIVGTEERTYTTDTANQLKSDGIYNYEYDGEGNQVKRIALASDETRILTYDHHNRLVQVDDWSSDPGDPYSQSPGAVLLSRTAHDFDAFGRRIAEIVDVDVVGSAHTQTDLMVFNGDHGWADFNGTKRAPTRYFYGSRIDQIIARIGSDEDIVWYMTDRQHSIRDYSSSDGSIASHSEWGAFGLAYLTVAFEDGDRYGFQGREAVGTTGLHFFRARHYDPFIGGFTSQDPIGFSGGELRLYTFASNSPLNATDPSGLASISEWGAFGSLFAVGAILGGTLTFGFAFACIQPNSVYDLMTVEVIATASAGALIGGAALAFAPITLELLGSPTLPEIYLLLGRAGFTVVDAVGPPSVGIVPLACSFLSVTHD
ncbi:putative Ig domain-containing protein [Stieleria maiorica]|uniref:putative Ig domain-containing protein n=1 Tax=Stieleria maiorica TaxID=2795974 RepID=UPI001F202AD5|nr:putative Ig domain-containing protein [Stieleria maiorica]